MRWYVAYPCTWRCIFAGAIAAVLVSLPAPWGLFWLAYGGPALLVATAIVWRSLRSARAWVAIIAAPGIYYGVLLATTLFFDVFDIRPAASPVIEFVVVASGSCIAALCFLGVLIAISDRPRRWRLVFFGIPAALLASLALLATSSASTDWQRIAGLGAYFALWAGGLGFLVDRYALVRIGRGGVDAAPSVAEAHSARAGSSAG